MNAQDRFEALLKENDFRLIRQRKHLVYRNPDGLQFVAAKSPSDHRAAANSLSDLRRVLNSVPEASKTLENERFQPVLEPQEPPKPVIRERAIGLDADRYWRIYKPQPQLQTQRVPTTKRFTLLDLYQINTCLRRELLRSFNQFRLNPEHDPDFDAITVDDREAIAASGMQHLPDSELLRRKQRFWLDRFREHNLRLDRACQIATRTTQQTVKSLRKFLVVRITSAFIERRQLSPEGEAKLALEFAAYLVKTYTPIFEETPNIVKSLVGASVYHWPLCMQLALAYRLRFEADGILISTFHGRGPDAVAAG